jgi:DNA-binding LacI/PurR family transcriptional regulator
MTKPATVNDVAAAAGVSRQTVSNVLNSPGIVRPATRDRVQSIITEFGYRPHASARRLRTRRAATIGVRIDQLPDDISASLLDRFLHALTERADANDLRVVLYTASNPQDEIASIARMIEGSDVDAFVLTSTFHGDPRTAWLIDHGQTFVTFGRPWGVSTDDPRYLWVDVDGAFGTRTATEFLIAGGAKRVAFLGWPQGSDTGDDRRAGWRSTMLEHGFAGEQLDNLNASSENDVRAGRVAAQRLMEHGIDAVVAASDTLALAAMLVVGPRLPVVGFDNSPVAVSMGFPSVDQRLGAVADEVLSLLRHGANGGTHRIVSPELVLRDGGAP